MACHDRPRRGTRCRHDRDVRGHRRQRHRRRLPGEAAVAAPDAVTAEAGRRSIPNADGVISTTEAAHSARTGGKNCNHGGYVSWIAQHKHDCVTAPTEEEPTAEEPVTATSRPKATPSLARRADAAGRRARCGCRRLRRRGDRGRRRFSQDAITRRPPPPDLAAKAEANPGSRGRQGRANAGSPDQQGRAPGARRPPEPPSALPPRQPRRKNKNH